MVCHGPQHRWSLVHSPSLLDNHTLLLTLHTSLLSPKTRGNLAARHSFCGSTLAAKRWKTWAVVYRLTREVMRPRLLVLCQQMLPSQQMVGKSAHSAAPTGSLRLAPSLVAAPLLRFSGKTHLLPLHVTSGKCHLSSLAHSFVAAPLLRSYGKWHLRTHHITVPFVISLPEATSWLQRAAS